MATELLLFPSKHEEGLVACVGIAHTLSDDVSRHAYLGGNMRSTNKNRERKFTHNGTEGAHMKEKMQIITRAHRQRETERNKDSFDQQILINCRTAAISNYLIHLQSSDFYLGEFPGLHRLNWLIMSHSFTWQVTKLWPFCPLSSCKHTPPLRIWSILDP